jgi:hypothetical protein
MAHWLGYDLNLCKIWLKRGDPDNPNRGGFCACHVEVSEPDQLLRVIAGPVAEAISKGEPTDKLIHVGPGEPDYEPIRKLTKSLAGGRSKYWQQNRRVEYQTIAAPILRQAQAGIDDISERLMKALEEHNEAVLAGNKLHEIAERYQLHRREAQP